MSSIYRFLVAVCAIMALGACKKQTPVKGNFAVLRIYGVIKDNEYLVTNFKGSEPLDIYKDATRISAGGNAYGFNKFYVYDSPQSIGFYYYKDTMPKSEPVLKLDLELEKGQIYTLFLSGTRNVVDTLLIKENIPTFETTDSSTVFRFVNLSNDAPVSVNLKDEPYGSLISSLPYQGISAWFRFPLVANMQPYEFEVRDAATGELLATYKDNDMTGAAGKTHRWLQKSRNHVFYGIRGETSSANKPQVRGFYDTY
jgi:hypothetical protein